jgi:hypothetical protein
MALKNRRNGGIGVYSTVFLGNLEGWEEDLEYLCGSLDIGDISGTMGGAFREYVHRPNVARAGIAAKSFVDD